MMSMSEKSYGRSGIQEAVQRLGRSEHVFILILKRAVYQNNAVCGKRSLWQRGKPVEILRAQLRARPIHRGFRDWIEICGFHQARYGFVVIPANHLSAKFAKPGDDFMWIGTVAHHITEAHGDIPAACG